MNETRTKEHQNQVEYDSYLAKAPVRLGPWSSWIWRSDPKHLCFALARYKFCSKLLEGKKRVLDVGCGDAFALPIILQTVEFVYGVDFEPVVIEEARKLLDEEILKRCELTVLDITRHAIEQKVDAAYSLDVIEHIPPQREHAFMRNVCNTLPDDGICIIGTPNIEAKCFAGPQSAAGHINLKSAQTLRKLLSDYFDNVFIFSMNDEVVHTGYYGMAHYLIALGAGRKDTFA